MSTSLLRPILVLVLVLASCRSLPGPVAQLQRYKDAEVAKKYTAIEADPVNADCQNGGADDVCSQLFEISARACLQLVADEAGPNAMCPMPSDQANKRLDCAATGFAAARQRGKFSPDQVADFTQMRARALYCGATLRNTADGVPLDKQAVSELAALPADPGRDHIAASASYNIANREDLPTAQRCSAAQQAVQLAQRGLAGSPDPKLAEGLRGTLSGARGVIKRLKCKGA